MRSIDVAAVLIALALLAHPSPSRAQSCCAGSGVVTPGRLGLHDFVLVGAQLRAAALVGSFDTSGNYVARGRGTTEDDFEQDLFGAIRLLRRGQVALLVPFVESTRHAGRVTDVGGGLGDINASARYDFLYAGQSRFVPGFAVLAGVTLPIRTSRIRRNRDRRIPIQRGCCGRAVIRLVARRSLGNRRGANAANGWNRQRDIEPSTVNAGERRLRHAARDRVRARARSRTRATPPATTMSRRTHIVSRSA